MNFKSSDKIIVKSFGIVGNINHVKHLTKKRWFICTSKFKIVLNTNFGKIIYEIEPGLETDGRSGGRLIDWLFPHWGNNLSKACVIVHDLNFHDIGFTFEQSNDILRQMIALAGYAKWRSDLVYYGVSTAFAKTHFGNNTEEEKRNMIFFNVRVE